MFEQLNVLLLESQPGTANIARAELEAAGHNVWYCHDADGPAFPCNALIAGHGCPLEDKKIDVALDVRRHPRFQPTVREDGVTCAVRRHIPVVVAGAEASNPYGEFAAETLARTWGIVEPCERAAAAPLERHTAAAAAALREMLARRDIAVAPEVTVQHRRGALLISVAGAGALDTATRSMAAVRMRAAVRAIDDVAPGVDVVFDWSDEVLAQ